MTRMRFGAAALVAFALALAPSRADAGEKVKIAVPEKENAQYLVYWVAKGGGHFYREGLDVETVLPATPGKTEGMLERGEVDAAVLTPPMALRLVAGKKPIVIAAKVFENDPHAIVASADAAKEKNLAPSAPLDARIAALRGMKIGTPPDATGRLDAVLASKGLEKETTTVVSLAREVVPGLEAKKVDAAFLASPFLEAALAKGAVVLVDLPRGELAPVKQAHVFGIGKNVVDTRQGTALAMVRALASASRSIHVSHDETVKVLAAEMPGKSKEQLDAVVRVYASAVPESIVPHPEELAASAVLVPEGVPKPDLAGVDVAAFYGGDLARSAERPPAKTGMWIGAALGVVTIVLLVVAVRGSKKKKSEDAST